MRFPFKQPNERGFSLLELLIAGAIFSGVVLGVLKVFTSAKSLAPPFITKGVQSNIAREKLEGLYESVRQDQWTSSSNALYPGTYTPTLSGHATTYTISNVSGTDYRKTEITVS